MNPCAGTYQIGFSPSDFLSVATHSEGTETTRKSVRPDVQLLISQHAVRGDHCVERRRLRGDALEQLCDGLAACERRSTVERRRFSSARGNDREVEHNDVGIGGCPGDYTTQTAAVAASVDLNHDGVICEKPVGSANRVNDIDNQSSP